MFGIDYNHPHLVSPNDFVLDPGYPPSPNEHMRMDPRLAYKIYVEIYKKWLEMYPGTKKEFKVVAAFVAIPDDDPVRTRVLSIGTGSKCILAEHLYEEGEVEDHGRVLFDSHADIIARGSFVCLLYEHLHALLDQKVTDDLILERSDSTVWGASQPGYRLKPNIKIYFYGIQAPCNSAKNGASQLHAKRQQFLRAFNLTTDCSDEEDGGGDGERDEEGDEDGDEDCDEDCDEDGYEEGNDAQDEELENSEQLSSTSFEEHADFDEKEKEEEYEEYVTDDDVDDSTSEIGETAFWTNNDPDRSMFMCCSAKMAKWNVIGVQGALLSGYLEPVYLSGFVVSVRYNFEQMVNGLYGRINHPLLCEKLGQTDQWAGGFKVNEPLFGTTPNRFNPFDVKKTIRQGYLGHDAHNWYEPLNLLPTDNPFQGHIEVTNSRIGTLHFSNELRLSEQSRLSKLEFARRYRALNELEQPPLLNTRIDAAEQTYESLKAASSAYQNAKKALYDSFEELELGSWMRTDSEFNMFHV